jgi:ParB/RepB/Spo0J family partition protein
MATTIDINEIDLRYANYRLQNNRRETELLTSILEKGIIEPLYIIGKTPYILIDGFKRYRCAKKLNISTIPYILLDEEEAVAIIKFIRHTNNNILNIVEQAQLINELKTTFQMTTREIAQKLERSIGWVGMRLGLLNEMSDIAQKAIFSGRFPVYSFMYTLRQFMRMNKVSSSEVDNFIQATAGKKLSTRDIELLANGYFHGGEYLKDQIKLGNLNWSLDKLKNLKTSDLQNSMNDFDRQFIRDLEIIQKYMSRLDYKINNCQLTNPIVLAQSNLLSEGILSQLNQFSKTLRRFYDKSR